MQLKFTICKTSINDIVKDKLIFLNQVTMLN